MTTPNNQPAPPPGMEILADYTKPLPSGAMIQMSDGWAPSDVILGSRPHPAFIYAIPITVPATGDTTADPSCDPYFCWGSKCPVHGDTTNEKGGKQRKEGTCATCALWQPCPTVVKGCEGEMICGKSRHAGFGFHGQDGRAVITPAEFGCIFHKPKPTITGERP